MGQYWLAGYYFTYASQSEMPNFPAKNSKRYFFEGIKPGLIGTMFEGFEDLWNRNYLISLVENELYIN